MSVLVTVDGGFVGYNLVKQLVGHGAKVSYFSRDEHPVLQKLGAKLIQGDLLAKGADETAITKACKDKQTVYHTASVNGDFDNYDLFYQGNVIATQNVIKACIAQGVKKLIYTSTASGIASKANSPGDKAKAANEPVLNHYQKTKMLAEKRVLSANGVENLITNAIRPHCIWGPGDKYFLPQLLDRAANKRLQVIGDGLNQISVTYVENAAYAHILAAMTDNIGGNAYFVAEEKPVIFWKWLKMILDELKLPLIEDPLSYRRACYSASFQAFLKRTFRFKSPPKLTREYIDAVTLNYCYSIKGAKQDFEYKALVPPKEAMDKTLRYFRGKY